MCLEKIIVKLKRLLEEAYSFKQVDSKTEFMFNYLIAHLAKIVERKQR